MGNSKQQELAQLLDLDIAENYDKIVADPDRTVTYKSLAKEAKDKNDPVLEAWAKERDDGKKPVEAPVDDTETRELSEVTDDEHTITVDEQPHVSPAPAPARADNTPVTEEGYEALTIPQLKELAESRKLDISGAKLKQDYIDVLLDNDTAPAAAE